MKLPSRRTIAVAILYSPFFYFLVQAARTLGRLITNGEDVLLPSLVLLVVIVMGVRSFNNALGER